MFFYPSFFSPLCVVGSSCEDRRWLVPTFFPSLFYSSYSSPTHTLVRAVAAAAATTDFFLSSFSSSSKHPLTHPQFAPGTWFLFILTLCSITPPLLTTPPSTNTTTTTFLSLFCLSFSIKQSNTPKHIKRILYERESPSLSLFYLLCTPTTSTPVI